jgi:hypothetical protein
MSSIIMRGDTFHGISVFGRGVFTTDKRGARTYAGQCRDGYACGLGVTTWSDGDKVYGEHSPDGKFDGRCLYRQTDGGTRYCLFERGEPKAYARSSDGPSRLVLAPQALAKATATEVPPHAARRRGKPCVTSQHQP